MVQIKVCRLVGGITDPIQENAFENVVYDTLWICSALQGFSTFNLDYELGQPWKENGPQN